MDTIAIILIAVGVAALLLLIGGLAATRRRDARGAADYSRHVAAADQALAQARAADRGWDRSALDAAARSALARDRPGFAYDDLHLILVDDRPGIEEDRAHFAAVGSEGETRVVLVRDGDGWAAERVE